MRVFRVHISYSYVAIGNMHVRTIRNLILLSVAFQTFSISINLLHAIASPRLIYFVPSSSASINRTVGEISAEEWQHTSMCRNNITSSRISMGSRFHI